MDEFCTVELIKRASRTFESGCGQENDDYFSPIFTEYEYQMYTREYELYTREYELHTWEYEFHTRGIQKGIPVYGIHIPVYAIWYSYSRVEHGNIKSDSRVGKIIFPCTAYSRVHN
jgi:hypothetical protein